MKSLTGYSRLLFKRVYRPVKPFISPLVSRIKIWQVLSGLLVLMLLGGLVKGWSLSSKDRASYWPWSSKSHAEMAIFWFEAGDEKRALDELSKANKSVIIRTKSVKESLRKAEEKVLEPERIREEIESWEKVLRERPFFRDVLLRLSILNYQIYENEKAKDYFIQAEYLDPINEDVLDVKKIIYPL